MRILLADDQEPVRRALRLLLEQETHLEIGCEVAEAAGLRAAIMRYAPDIILLDWELPGLNVSDLLPLSTVNGRRPIMIAMSSHPEAQQAALDAGVAACINKGRPAADVLRAIRDALGREV